MDIRNLYSQLPHISLILLLLAQAIPCQLTVTGVPGEVGATGLPGAPGLPGAQGAKGDKGPTGAPGIQGEQGYQGATGSTGATGIGGASGDVGADGQAGPAGNPGVSGDTGSPGSTGATGATGVKGPQGPTGAKGEKGDDGPRASAGQQGEKGSKGDQGIPGIKGNMGFQGVQGIKGETGDPGQADVNECQQAALTGIRPCPTDVLCINHALGYDCQCPDGYQYNQQTNTCDDVDECNMGNFGNCDNECQNVDGSYNCACSQAGFELSPKDKHSCIDINECDRNRTLCDTAENAVCVNTYGSFLCVDTTATVASPDPAGDAQASTVVENAMVSTMMIIVLVIWCAFLTLLLIIIAIMLIMKRQNHITEQKTLAKSQATSR